MFYAQDSGGKDRSGKGGWAGRRKRKESSSDLSQESSSGAGRDLRLLSRVGGSLTTALNHPESYLYLWETYLWVKEGKEEGTDGQWQHKTVMPTGGGGERTRGPPW